MDFFDNHKKLFRTALGLFVGLTIIVAIMPAINNQENNSPLPGYEPLSQEAYLGKKVFIANGCVACHTQQVRNVEMDNIWGNRPGIPADYAGISRTDFWINTATLMGTERTGPDLTNIGSRQPSLAWNLLHLFQPRAVVEKSIMPAYPWLFEVKNELGEKDVEVVVPDVYRKGINGKIIATQEALHLVAYLQSLKQTPLPDGKTPMEFLYKKKEMPAGGGSACSCLRRAAPHEPASRTPPGAAAEACAGVDGARRLAAARVLGRLRRTGGRRSARCSAGGRLERHRPVAAR